MYLDWNGFVSPKWPIGEHSKGNGNETGRETGMGPWDGDCLEENNGKLIKGHKYTPNFQPSQAALSYRSSSANSTDINVIEFCKHVRNWEAIVF